MGLKSKSEFKQLFKELYSPLCNYAYSYLSDHALAEDAVQDVFIIVWKKRESLAEDINFKAYLFTSVKNKAFEYIRKNSKRHDNQQKMLNTWEEAAGTPINDEVDKFLLKEKLNNSIRQLPTKCRDIFVLSKVEGLSYDEIAELRQISKKTVENHISNAFKLLRKILRE